MQQRPPGSADGSMPDPFRQPTEYLLAFLHRIAVFDKEGFFQRPVREEEAPNYYNVIKQPMCFADMREKINTGAYQTWRQLRDDFNLIHENARRFNSSKTLVHRAALNLQKNGTKILATYELEVRKALAVLHPLGSQQSAALGQGAIGPYPSAEARLDMVPSPAAAVDQNGDGGGLDGSLRANGSGPPSPDVAADSLKLDAGINAGGSLQPLAPPFSSLLLPAFPRDPLVGYISDEDDQPLLVVGTEGAAGAVASAAGCSLPGLGPTHALPWDGLLSQVRSTAVRVPYSQRPRQRSEQRLGSGAASAGTADGGSGTGAAAGSRAVSKEWKRARRSVEVQARWLELRMRELRGQQDRLRNQIDWLQQRANGGAVEAEAAAAVAAAAHGGPNAVAAYPTPTVGVLMAAAARASAPCAVEREALDVAALGFLTSGRIASSPYLRMRGATKDPRAADAAPSSATCVSADDQPSTSAAAGAAPRPATSPAAAAAPEGPRVLPQRPQDPRLAPNMPPPPQPQGPGRPPPPGGRGTPVPLPAESTFLSPQQQQPVDDADADKMAPGAVHASLELLEQRLSFVRARLQDAFRFDPHRMAMGRAQGAYGGGSRAPSVQLSGPGSLPQVLLPSTASQGAPGVVKRQSSGQGRRPGSLTVLTRFDSMGMPSGKNSGAPGGGKRKRSEIELLTGDMGTPLASYSRTSLDRSVSASAIVIPPVRDLPPDEFRARIVAATTWSQLYHTVGPSALDTVPPEIMAVLGKRRRRGLLRQQVFMGDDLDDDMGMGAPGLRPGGGGPGGPDEFEEGGVLPGLGGCSDSGFGDEEASSSSSEDTSDEAYAARHRLMEEEEHQRYAAVMAEGQRRRNKGSGSSAAGQQQSQGGPGSSSGAGEGRGGSASQAKDRAKFGNKTPRNNKSFTGKDALFLIPPDMPFDPLESGPPSATQFPSYPLYQPYQPPMVGVTASMSMPPTPGAMTSPAGGTFPPQPLIAQQVVAQRTSSPPAILQISPTGAAGPHVQRQAVPLTTATAPPTTPLAAPPGPGQQAPLRPGQPPASAPPQRPPAALPVIAPPPQLSPRRSAPQHVPQTQAESTAGGAAAGSEPMAVDAPGVVTGKSSAPAPQQQPQQPEQQSGPAERQEAQPTASVQPPQPSAAAGTQAQLALAAGQQQQAAPAEAQAPQQQQPHSATTQTSEAAAAAEAVAVTCPARGLSGRAEAPASPITATLGTAATTTAASAAVATATATVAAAPSEAPAEEGPAGASEGSVSALVPAATEATAAAAAGEGADKTAGAATTEAAAADGLKLSGDASMGAAAAAGATDPAAGSAVTSVTPVAQQPQAAAGTSGGQTPQLSAALLSSLTGAGSNSAAMTAMVAAAAAQGQGQHALLASPAAAVLAAQSPAVSMQFLANVPGLTGGTGNSNALTAAATSILLAAAAAASAGGQGAAASLMGGARQTALQQLAAGTPAAQVLANAAAAAAAAAGSLPGAFGNAGATQGKAQTLFAGAAGRGMPGAGAAGQAALVAAAAAAGGMAGLPAAFQSFQGFPQSLAGFSVGGQALGLATQQQGVPQWLLDGRGGGAGPAQGLPAAAAPASQRQAPAQGQAAPPPEGRGAPRGRRPARVVTEEDDEDWEEEEEEEEEAVSPSSRSRRSGRVQRRGSNGTRADGHGAEGTRQSRRRAAKGAHNWAVLLASESEDEDDEGDEEWRAGRREGGRGRGRGRRSAG